MKKTIKFLKLKELSKIEQGMISGGNLNVGRTRDEKINAGKGRDEKLIHL